MTRLHRKLFGVLLTLTIAQAAFPGPAPDPPPSPTPPASPAGFRTPVQDPQTGRWVWSHTKTNVEAVEAGAPGVEATGAAAANVNAKDGVPPHAALSDSPEGKGGGADGGTGSFDAIATAAATSNATRWTLGIVGVLIAAWGWVAFKLLPWWSLKYALECTAAGGTCITVAILWAHLLVALLIAFAALVCVLVFEMLHGSFTIGSANSKVEAANAAVAVAQNDTTSLVKWVDKLRSDPVHGGMVQQAMAQLKPVAQNILTPGAKAVVAQASHT